MRQTGIKPLWLLIPVLLTVLIVACEIGPELTPTEESPPEDKTPVVVVTPEAPSIFTAAGLIGSATTLLEGGDLGGAEAFLKESLVIDPDNPAALHKLGFALLGQEQYAAAIEVFTEELAVDSRFPDAWLGLGLALAGSGRQSEALDALDMALRLDPENEDALQARQALAGSP